MFQSAALAAALCVVLTAIFAMHNAHELHVASLERQIEDARAHTTTIVDTLERRISILDAQIERLAHHEILVSRVLRLKNNETT